MRTCLLLGLIWAGKAVLFLCVLSFVPWVSSVTLCLLSIPDQRSGLKISLSKKPKNWPKLDFQPGQQSYSTKLPVGNGMVEKQDLSFYWQLNHGGQASHSLHLWKVTVCICSVFWDPPVSSGKNVLDWCHHLCSMHIYVCREHIVLWSHLSNVPLGLTCTQKMCSLAVQNRFPSIHPSIPQPGSSSFFVKKKPSFCNDGVQWAPHLACVIYQLVLCWPCPVWLGLCPAPVLFDDTWRTGAISFLPAWIASHQRQSRAILWAGLGAAASSCSKSVQSQKSPAVAVCSNKGGQGNAIWETHS